MGEMQVTRITGPIEDRYVITRADPQIRIHTNFLQEIYGNPNSPSVSLVDGVLTLRGDNRTVAYKIDWDSFDGATYAAEQHDPLRG